MAFLKKHSISLFIVLTVILSLPLLVVQARQEQDQRQFASASQNGTTTISPSSISPSFYPLAPCPTCDNPSPSIPNNNGSQNPSSGTTAPSGTMSNPFPSEPCEAEQSSLAHNKKKKGKSGSKHSGEKGAISEGVETLLKLFLELLNLLLKLLGGGGGQTPQIPVDTTDQPQPTTTPPCTPATPSETPVQPSQGATEPSPSQAVPAPSQAVPSQPAPSVVVPSGVAPSGAQASSIDLTNWKLTLPTGTPGKPTEILQPQLATFTQDPWFTKLPGGGLKFRAAVNGVTTSGSSYPRSELREMNGTALASWESATGTHTMIIEQAIMKVPTTKKHVVAGQIHDSEDDVIVIRLEDKKLFVDIGGTAGTVLDGNYTLGKRFSVKFEVSGGQTKVYYNNATTPAQTYTPAYSAAYFKAGAYTQSNCTTDTTDCSANNYGEVEIYRLEVSHK